MANAVEIVTRLKAGEIVYLDSEDVGIFMLECYRHGITSGAIRLRYAHGRCRMQLATKPQETEKDSNHATLLKEM